MQQRLVSFLRKLPYPAPVFAQRFDKSPISNVTDLVNFTSTRASYIAQTSLHGYLKTRMGSSFRKVFEDPQFSPVIHRASVCLFGSCLVDITVYIGGKFSQQRLWQNPQHCAELCSHVIENGIDHMLDENAKALLDNQLLVQAQQRFANIDWQQASDHTVAFAWSTHDILRYAPVIEQYKQLDATIVENSIRFRWCNICGEADKRLQGEKIIANWHSNNSIDSVAMTKP